MPADLREQLASWLMPATCAALLALAAWYALALPAMLLRALGLLPPQLGPLDLSGKHVLVTGGSQGLGLALAEGCAARGARVSVLARSAAPLELARMRIQAVSAPGHTAVAVAADVTDAPATAAAVKAAVAAQGGRAVDVLIAAAGAAEPGYFLDQPAELFERQMRLNYLGTVHAIQAVLPAMVERPPASRGRGGGADCRLVLVGSGASAIAFLGYAAYAPTKFAVKGLAEALRNELCGSCVTVHLAYPPDTATDGFQREQFTKPAENKAMFPLDLHSPTQVASVILRALVRRAAPFHLPSPDPVQNLLVNSVAGATPRWSVLGDALLSPLAVCLEGLVVVWMDRVARPYGQRLWTPTPQKRA